MQKHLLLPCLLFWSHLLWAQVPEDALRASWITPSGTARQQAIGGAMGSLGGEISANFVNPAGLGLYRTNEIVISPGWKFASNKDNYLGNKTSAPSISKFSIGTSGIVTSYLNANGKNNIFSIAVNRTADFNGHIHYSGRNDYSSGAEQYAEEFSRSHYGIEEGIGSPGLSYGTRMALWTSLIDTATLNGDQTIIAQPQKAGLLLQDNDIFTTGGITEIALSLATGFNDKWLIGGGLGIPIMHYSRSQTFYEADATGNTNNDFESYTYKENFTSKGWGLNAKIGVLYRPGTAWRIGLAIHSPTVYGVTDKIHASMVTRTENYTSLRQVSTTSDSLDQIVGLQSPANTVDYNLYTPWKFIVSGSYVFGGNDPDVRRQKGFVTADLEYTTNRSSHFRPASDVSDNQNSYFNSVNDAIKTSYKNTMAMRLGGELKFNTLMARAGAAWYSNPYRDNALKADRILLSAGIGYRNQGMFIDLAYVMAFTRDISFPYLLADKGNIYSDLKQRAANLVMTIGFKL